MAEPPFPPARDDAMDRFLARVAASLDLPEDGALALRNLDTLRGPAGLLCRLRIGANERAPAVRPEVLLPLAPAALRGLCVERLLALLEVLVSELGWTFGPSSEGWLLLRTLDWLDEPAAVAAALDVGQMLGMSALRELGQDPAGVA